MPPSDRQRLSCADGHEVGARAGHKIERCPFALCKHPTPVLPITRHWPPKKTGG